MSKQEENMDNKLDKWFQENNPREAMRVPEGYFDGFADQVINNVNGKTKTGKPLLIKKIRTWSAIAACAALLVTATFLLRSNVDTNVNLFAEVSEEQAWSYVFENDEAYSLDDLAAFEDLDETLTDMESELYGNQVSDEFLEDIDIQIIEDIYE